MRFTIKCTCGQTFDGTIDSSTKSTHACRCGKRFMYCHKNKSEFNQPIINGHQITKRWVIIGCANCNHAYIVERKPHRIKCACSNTTLVRSFYYLGVHSHTENYWLDVDPDDSLFGEY